MDPSNKELIKFVAKTTGATDVRLREKIASLWSGYGEIQRFELRGAALPSVVVKCVRPPKEVRHPRGWAGDFSHKRKLKSYRVEAEWYRNWRKHCSDHCYAPKSYGIKSEKSDFVFVLEDLEDSGYSVKKRTLSNSELLVCLRWLACFHGTFIGSKPEQLWKTGTYWHLATRPDELKALEDRELRIAAGAIDLKLQECSYKTLVHGDAKLANFCFSRDGERVAAVDFQYVGGGCGMKDVAYFLGSCLDESECEAREDELLDFYFEVLAERLKTSDKEIDIELLISQWRELYHFAWADFHRFLKGWSPQHWKINSYSERVTREVLKSLRASIALRK